MVESRGAGTLFGALIGGLALAAMPLAAQESKVKPVPPGPVRILTPEMIETRPAPPPPPVDPALAAPEPDTRPSYQEPRYRKLADPEFEPFADEGEFRRLMRAIEKARRSEGRRRYGAADGGQTVIALMQDAEPECAVPEDCPAEDSGDRSIVVTGTRVTPTAMSSPVAVTAVTTANGQNITNTQVAAVDEGDIVKLIGEYLLVLQDGRVFAVHYPTMRLTDRVDVYRKDKDGEPIGADWYDEMLVQGDQIIVTAYSYQDDATEITVLKLDQTKGTVAVRGVFLISSDDYYDVDNYATRIVGDKLVVYTPYEADDLLSRRGRPAIRRWSAAEEFDDARGQGRALLDIRKVYRPVFGVRDPWVHTVSVCPLGEVTTKGLECETTGFVGSDMAEMFVAGDAVYLWTLASGSDELAWDSCPAGTPAPRFGEVPPAAVYRIPLGRGEVEVMGARGMPVDQFGMDANARRFRALPSLLRNGCDDDGETQRQFALFDASQQRFSDYYAAATEREFTPVPPVGGNGIENRFTSEYLVYGGRDGYWRRPPDDADERERALAGSITVVPLSRPAQPQRIALGHNLIRLEKIGDGAVIANGYANEEGLRVSFVTLARDGAGATLGTSAMLPGRYESEGRSHAFNATITAAGDGMLGVPTVTRIENSKGYWWYSDVSDLSFLGFDGMGTLGDAGLIAATPEDQVKTGEGYDCEVSCIDWYGNARPIFLAGKVYGLMGTELVEAEVVTGKVAERRRVDLTGSLMR
ncbi:beta-propeller domain-containing protein [Erythrobacter sp. CCH5-A1]|jgi:hypothetical protein|uniref:beta-propeller domain-containing protein n=1 Tax=Erythrobacter sp. CCH5-A1 TaxID=1768792 RepID=UPI00082DE5D1|nr:beta-propeller domain-containing protein [Erythrobacter sp. CCH5-A1]